MSIRARALVSFLACSCPVACSAAADAALAPLALSLGELPFSVGASAVLGGPWVVRLDDSATRVGTVSPLLSAALAACGGSLEGFLPPRAFLVHVPAPAASRCAVAVHAVPGVAASTELPPALRSPLLAVGGTSLATAAPVRVLSVTLAAAPSSAAELAADLAPLLSANGGGVVIVATGNARLALVSALAACPDTACTLAAPAGACGGACVVPAAVIEAVAGHAAVLWTESVAPAFASNAHARAATQTTDVVNSQDVAAEYGACGDAATECAFINDVPFSRIKDLYSKFLALDDSPPAQALDSLPPTTPAATALGGLARASAGGLPSSARRVVAATAFSNAAAAGSDAAAAPSPPFSGAVTSPPVVLSPPLMGEFFREQQLRDSQGASCTATCSSPACGIGYASCGGLVTPLPLDGTGQLVNVVDSGVDYRHPFYYDSTYTVVPTKLPPLALSSHRKVPAYWSYMDATDYAGGHGTHVCGSVAGNAATVANANDAPVLGILSGMAPLARIVLTDIGCSTTGGCAPPPSVPSSDCASLCPANERAIYIPADLSALFQPAYDAGVRISTNSWGGGTEAYGAAAVALDAYTALHPGHLLLFAAMNDGQKGNGFATLSGEAVSKNVLTVGATQDGLPAHLLKIAGGSDVNVGALPPLKGPYGPGGCGTVLATATAAGVTTCGTLSSAQCATLANAGLTIWPPPQPFADIALCCGCTPKQIFDGVYASAGMTAVDFKSLLTKWEKAYNTRVTAEFSSRGPTLDGRIKPDIAAPGIDIMSARAGAGAMYNTFSCPATPSAVSNALDQTFKAYTGTGAGIESLLAITPVTTTEAVSFTEVGVPFNAITTGTLFLGLLQLDVTGIPSRWTMALSPLLVPTPGGPYVASFPIALDLGPGYSGLWVIAASAGFQFSLATTTTVSAGTQCFGTLPSARSGSSGFEVAVTRARGGPLAWVMPDNGTSMATPIVAGNVALVRQYFVDGYYPSGKAAVGAGFAPSAALLKSVIVNSASPVIDAALAALTSATAPNAQQVMTESGHGIVNLARGLSFATLGSAARSSGGLVTLVLPGLGTAGADPTIADGAASVYCVDTTAGTAGASLPLSLTLVWTDPAGSPLALYALVNDLDLEVYLPDSAAVIYGNNDPTAAAQQPDARNNVEKVLLAAPAATLSATGARLKSPYRVIVRGTLVPTGPLQAYSLVVTGPGVTVSTAACGGDPSVPPAAAAASGVTPTVAALIATSAVLACIIAVGIALALSPALLQRLRARGGYGDNAQLLLTPPEGATAPPAHYGGGAPYSGGGGGAPAPYGGGGGNNTPAPTFMQPQQPLLFRKRDDQLTPAAYGGTYGAVLPGEVVNIPVFAQRS